MMRQDKKITREIKTQVRMR